MMQWLRGKGVVLWMVVLFVLYVGYRVYENKSDAAQLRARTLEDAVPTVAA
ncbi:MAG: hypothetical protein H8K06_21250, partial [Nitrospira sp.]|nr:hypothetical protein [Nitrospira sp.]